MIKYQQLKMQPGYTKEDILQRIAGHLHIPKDGVRELTILRESIDARRKPDVFYTLSVAFSCDREREILKKYGKRADISLYEPKEIVFPTVSKTAGASRPVVIGAGPAGLFCAYYLAKAGLEPVLLERGKPVEERIADVENFWETGVLKPDSNVQFGEGGAGTFSDGKLNTLNKDPFGYQKEILKLFVEMGADPAVLYEQKPHLGTDRLVDIVKNLREEIKRLGGTVRFGAKATDFLIEDTLKQTPESMPESVSENRAESASADMPKRKRIVGVVVNDKEQILSDCVVMAIGHSARDTFEMLRDRGFAMEAKAFAVGYRVQHPQKLIDQSQYGEENIGKFPPAPYKLTAQARNGRGVYSFCMCPGGYVVNSSSEEGMLCINGMSYHDRAGENANSAVIISVTPEDFETDGPLSGMYFQKKLERRAYEAGGGKIPVQRLEDYKCRRASVKEGGITPQMKGQYALSDLRGILPGDLETAFLDGMEQFGRKIPGFDRDDTILAGIEARTSSPVRILRNQECEAEGIGGVYPCGEGAGYAGGITSAATDGLRVALAVMNHYRGGERQ